MGTAHIRVSGISMIRVFTSSRIQAVHEDGRRGILQLVKDMLLLIFER